MRKSDRYAAWLTEASWEAKRQRPAHIAGPYVLSVEAARPDRRARDIDNILKAVSDLLEGVGKSAMTPIAMN